MPLIYKQPSIRIMAVTPLKRNKIKLKDTKTMITVKVREKQAMFKRKRDNYTNKSGRAKLINYLRSELLSSSTHGLPCIVKERIHWFERLFWVVNFLFCTGLIIYLLSAQYSRFIETPIVMSVEMDYFNWNVSYPAFTLCPIFKPDVDVFAALVNESYERTGHNMESYLWSIISANIENIDLLPTPSADVLPLIDPKDYVVIAAAAFRKLDIISITTNTNWPIRVESAMTELGMCHVVNSNVAVYHDPNKWSKNMPYVKNNIELSVHDKDFFLQITNYADIYKLSIHSPDEILIASTSSYTDVVKGYISFGVQVWSTRISDELRQSPIRLRKCRFLYEPMNKRYPVYSYNHCMIECRITMIQKLCGCVPHFYRALDHERICNMAELKCVFNYNKEIMTLSSSVKTLRSFDYDKALPRSSRDCGCLSNCEADVYQKDSETFVPESSVNRLRIGISNYPKIRVVRNIIFSFYDILLRSGGVVNLCIGSSLLSIVELLLTIIRIPIFHLIHFFKYQ